ncbi:MAG: sigma-54-dependent Fis family transcriptional regulator [Nitrospirae bacterium]|nr:sigma-54-dependent Fis family transcriptional regulator [Nitrospirota bacterium]
MKITIRAIYYLDKEINDMHSKFNTDTAYVQPSSHTEEDGLATAEKQRGYNNQNTYPCFPLTKNIAVIEKPEVYVRQLITENKDMLKVIEKISQIAKTECTVVIQGETGTGKTMLARIIHSLSKRSPNKFVPVDMNAIPESLIETELFGHMKGSFTGAHKKKTGFFETAHEGTIFIDDLQNMSFWIQGKILSVIEEKKFYCVGSSDPVRINVRIIAATNNDIRKSLKDRRIRQDLFYRLGEVFINIPPLRERLDDIPLLFKLFVDGACIELGRPKLKYSDSIFKILSKHSWPGNVRELKNVARRAVLFCESDLIQDEHIDIISPLETDEVESDLGLSLKEITSRTVREVEIRTIRNALDRTGGNKKKASELLRVDYKTLINKIKEYEIEKR